MSLIDTFLHISYSRDMVEIKPDQVYTTEETREFLRVSERTIKRMLKNGIIRANKVGGRYRILGREILRLVSPETEEQAVEVYKKVREKTKDTIKHW